MWNCARCIACSGSECCVGQSTTGRTVLYAICVTDVREGF